MQKKLIWVSLILVWVNSLQVNAQDEKQEILTESGLLVAPYCYWEIWMIPTILNTSR